LSEDKSLKIFTIGFTKKNAEDFFGRLQKAGVGRVVDVRLNNVSQLAGFAKRDDLAYILRLLGIDYLHLNQLAPTAEILSAYRKKQMSWPEYEKRFLDLLAGRRVEETISPDELANSCLLCSEDKPHHCHRRLVAEYLTERWNPVDIQVAHL
jgi:uncharacterized protein (DUF488 family)